MFVNHKRKDTLCLNLTPNLNGGGGGKFLKTKKHAHYSLNTASFKSQNALRRRSSNEISQSATNDNDTIHSLCEITAILLRAKIQLMQFKQAGRSNVLIDDIARSSNHLVKEVFNHFYSLGYDPLLCLEKHLTHSKTQKLDFSECR